MAKIRQACREVAERAIEMLQEQVASNCVDIEAAEDFTVWADSKLMLPNHDQRLQVVPSSDAPFIWVFEVAHAGWSIITKQAGGSDEPQQAEESRQIEYVQWWALRLVDMLAEEEQDDEPSETHL